MNASTLKHARPDDAAPKRFRSGAVARMLDMPVATLRVWERRYQLSQAELSASGQRLYSADDVRRLALLKQLSERGHAIGSLAGLSHEQLQAVAATHAQVLADRRAHAPQPTPAGQRPVWVVIAKAAHNSLVARLQGMKPLPGWISPQLLGPFEDGAAAEAALQGQAVDLVLIQEAQLHRGSLAHRRLSAPRLAQAPTALLYRYGADALCQSLAQAGVRLLREPQPDAALAQWLQSALAQPGAVSGPVAVPAERQDLTPAPRRWSDAALADFAGLSSTVACECPRHLAELLMQMSHFETYSAQCESLSPADAELHRYLWRLAADCRARFEAALEHVARHEGLILPAVDR